LNFSNSVNQKALLIWQDSTPINLGLFPVKQEASFCLKTNQIGFFNIIHSKNYFQLIIYFVRESAFLCWIFGQFLIESGKQFIAF